MSEKNPYSTPEASLDIELDEKYQPNIFTFSGRIGRLRYLAYSFGISIILIIAMSVVMGLAAVFVSAAEINQEGMPVVFIVISGIYYILSIVFAVMFGKRRLNDLDKSGWWFLLFFVPIANIFVAIYILFFSGSEETNNFGAAPVENSKGVKIVALFIPLLFILGGILAAIAIPAYQDYVDRTKSMQVQ